MSLPEQFGWPQQKSEPNRGAVVSTMRNIINSFFNNTQMDTHTVTPKAVIADIPTTIIPPSVENSSTEQVAETTQNILTTVTDTITSTASNIVSTISNNIGSATPSIATGSNFNLTENTASNSTGFATNTNSTVLTELTGTNSTVDENGSTIDTITPQINSFTDSIKDILTTTTEKVINVTTDATNAMNQTDTHQPPENVYHDESVTVYVVLGLLLGILILIFIALLIIYKKYKKCRQDSGDYCVTQLKEVQSTSSIKTTSDLEDAHVKH